jgi:DNA-binding transcriptional MerR regulator
VNKAPDAFRTISEVAEELNVPQHVLRFWESRFREIKPMKRGGGRRYYRPDDVALLRGIRHLLYGEGYTIRGVQRILREHSVKFVQAVWQPDAPQPSPGAAEKVAAKDPAKDNEPDDRQMTEEAEHGRKLFGLLPTLLGDGSAADGGERPARKEPRPAFQQLVPPGAGRNTIPREDLRKLQAALHELGECRRLIDAALAGEM